MTTALSQAVPGPLRIRSTGAGDTALRPPVTARWKRIGIRLGLVGETPKFGRRTLLGGAVLAGSAVAGAGAIDSSRAYAATTASGMAPSGARGLGAGGRLLPPDSLPHRHLPPGTETIPQIEHVVVLMMENHSFDDHFGMLGRGDGLTLEPNGHHPVNYNPGPDNDVIMAYPRPNTFGPLDSDISQSWDQSHVCWDGGTNQGFAQNCGPASMGYFTRDQLPFYYSLANQFPIGDRYFCSVMAQTYPNRRFLIAGTALGDVSTNASGISSTDAPNGTIFDRFDAYGITWRDYYPISRRPPCSSPTTPTT
jgi:phospholipase C